ncbi:MAG: hypothetical protein NXI32_29395 [bacterium]|nr:hypothetical protein [bacterium]
MKPIDFRFSYLYGGAVIRPGQLVLLARCDYEDDTAYCKALITNGSTTSELVLEDDFYVGVIAISTTAHIAGQNGNMVSFSVSQDAKTNRIGIDNINQTRINDVDEFLDLIRIRAIENSPYCCGQFGQLYTYNESGWIRSDAGFRSLDSPDFEDIGGINRSELYAVGNEGFLAMFNGDNWAHVTLPSNENISAITAGVNKIFLAGFNGLVMMGQKHEWQLVGEPVENKNYRDIAFHLGVCYLLHERGVDIIEGNEVKPMKMARPLPSTARKFAIGCEELWLICEDSVFQIRTNSLHELTWP